MPAPAVTNKPSASWIKAAACANSALFMVDLQFDQVRRIAQVRDIWSIGFIKHPAKSNITPRGAGQLAKILPGEREMATPAQGVGPCVEKNLGKTAAFL